ncbi:MAG TPA: ABC transporter permease [Thermoplasmata archaeon]|nr:ABC transporter permease [Thermoplasmata archaeon]
MRPRRIGADLRIVARGYYRNPAALFFSLIFPLILISLFGLIFSASGSGPVTLEVLNEDSHSALAAQFLSALNNTTIVKVQVVPTASVTPSGFSAWLGQQGDPVGLVIPSDFTTNVTADRPVNLTVFANPQDAAAGGEALFAVSGVANAFNLAEAHGTPVIQVPPSKGVGSEIYSYIDYLIPGLIGFSILTSPMFAMVETTSSYRKEGLFRQLTLTPLTRGEWLASRILWYVVLTFGAAAIMLGIGVGVFGAHVSVGLGILPFLLVGPFFFVSLGMLAGSVAPTPESAAVIGNIITFPMMFLSGTFFPVSEFPSGLQTFAHVLPLYYVIDGMNQVMLFHNLARASTDLLVVVVAGVVVFLLAIRLFRWRDD